MLAKYLIFCFLAVGVWAAEEDVLELLDADFPHVLKNQENTLVMFYAPW